MIERESKQQQISEELESSRLLAESLQRRDTKIIRVSGAAEKK